MIHGGWARRPFDVAPDRTLDYDGTLFVAWEAAFNWKSSWRVGSGRILIITRR
jgi:hypothetical protein